MEERCLLFQRLAIALASSRLQRWYVTESEIYKLNSGPPTIKRGGGVAAGSYVMNIINGFFLLRTYLIAYMLRSDNIYTYLKC